ncbi:MAG: tetratricopeptide repeat protein [Bacteroidales bacterium]|nr:tetratricopeptide repeat protein [Bacteroidales bacterium]
MKLKFLRSIAAMIIMLGFAVNVNAQTATEAVDALKDGAAKSSAKDYAGALDAFKLCVSIYDELGETDNENRATAAKQIPKMQYKYAIGLYKQKKYDESVAAFETLKEYAATYEDAKMAKKATSTIPKVYYAKGASLLKAKDYTAAIEALDKSLELDPKYPMAYVRKAQVYKVQDDEANFKTSVDGAINAAIAKKDTKTEGTAKKLASSFYLKAGANAVKAKEYSKAVTYFNTLMEYKEVDSNIYYQLAIIYNKQSKWDASIEAGNKALELMGDVAETTTKDAKIYYELGNSYYGKGDNASACDAYGKANKGDYAETADYQMKHVVKCK